MGKLPSKRPKMGSQLSALAFAMFLVSACWGYDGCDFDECENDFNCGFNSVCDYDGFDLGRTCVAATECSTDAECPSGSFCFTRTRETDHPFESEVGKSVCACEDCGAGGFGTTNTGGAGAGTSGGSPPIGGGGASSGGAPSTGGGNDGGAGGGIPGTGGSTSQGGGGGQ
jgi:hypothetical protein